MTSAYVPDNTRSSIVIVLALALAIGLVGVLVGLSDKPDIEVLTVTVGNTAATAAAPAVAFDAGGDATEPAGSTGAAASAQTAPAGTVELDELGNPILDGPAGDGLVPDPDAAGVPAAEPTAPAPVPIPTATPTPEPTPEVAAAVEPTPSPEQSADDDPDAAGVPAAGGPVITAGTLEGQFFTKPDEEEGATVTQNTVQVSFSEDGSGSFVGVLDIVYPDETRIYLEMSGPLEWTDGNPQVTATITGTYGYDSKVDADDVASSEAELSITSLRSGSGSLCTPMCFGFTFPPQTGL